MSLLTIYLAALCMALVTLSHAAPQVQQSSFTNQEGNYRLFDFELQRFERLTSFMTNIHDRIGIPPEARTDAGNDPYVARDVNPSDLNLLPISYNHSDHANEMVLIRGDEIVLQCGIVNDEMDPDWVLMMRCPEEEAALKTYFKNLREYGIQIGIASDVLRNAPLMKLGTYRCILPTCSTSVMRPASVTITEVSMASPTASLLPSRFSLVAPESTRTPLTSHRERSAILNIPRSPTTNFAATRTQPSTLITAMSETRTETAFLGLAEVEDASHRIMRREIDLFAPMTCVPPPSTWKLTYNTWISFVFLTRSSTPPTGPFTPPWVTNSQFATMACRSVWAEAWNGLAGTTSVNIVTVEW